MAFAETAERMMNKTGMTSSQLEKKMEDENFKNAFFKAVIETIKVSFEVFKSEQII